jgi:homoaconitase/3-isopropylmalate dehydratase large subunit
MTCEPSIEMGARGGMIAPDQKTFDSLKEDCMFKRRSLDKS